MLIHCFQVFHEMGKALEKLNRFEEALDAYHFVIDRFASNSTSIVSESRLALVVLLQRMAVGLFDLGRLVINICVPIILVSHWQNRYRDASILLRTAAQEAPTPNLKSKILMSLVLVHVC